MKKSRDTQKGITLVALVVTIIVLLILAMVSIKIGMDKGLIGKATETKSIEVKQEEKEKLTLAYSEYQIGKNNNSKYTMQNALNNINADATANGDDMLGYNVVFAKTNNEYTITASGEIIEGIANRWDGKSKESPLITEDKNWHISTAAQLKYFADYVNGTLTEEEKDGIELTETTTVYLEKDIDLGARVNENGEKIIGEEWIPIGQTNDLKFIGVFDGQNHYISGVYVNVDGKFGGIFGNANTIKNLTVKDSYIEAKRLVGGIAGAARSGSIENCINQNTKVVVAESSAGGIVGQTVGEVKNCTNNGSVTGNGERIGGIVGNAGPSSIISNCYNTGNVSGAYSIGGIVGITFGTIDNCYNTASITGNGGAVGGILGQIGVGTSGVSTYIKNCYNLGTISGNDFLGGIIGWTSETKALGTIENNYNAGEIKGKDSVGGIIGRNSYKFVVKNCYNKGTVEGKTQVGTIIGNQTSSNVTNLSRMYYLNTINLSAIGNAETPETVRGIDNNFNSLEEFLNWLKNN